MRRSRPFALLVLALAGEARPSGFELYEESPAGTAMCGALTAVPGDASAIFYNPGGIALQRGGSALAGASIGTGSTSTISPDGTRTDARPRLFGLPTAFAATH